MYTNFEELLGKIITKIDVNKTSDDEIIFHLSNGAVYRQNHSQDCCESVYIEDVNGELDDLIGTPILVAEETTSDATLATKSESATWTFYKLVTKKGYVTIRWFGTSNGYYSESVSFFKIKCENIKDERKSKIIKIENDEDN